MKVVLDTNTLVSALIFNRERWLWLRQAWKSEKLKPLLCTETAKELIRVLAYPKFKLDNAEQQPLLQDIVPYCETVPELKDHKLEPCRDPKDQIFLLLAQTVPADFLVSGDEDLLSCTGQVSFRIVSPAQLRTLLEKD